MANSTLLRNILPAAVCIPLALAAGYLGAELNTPVPSAEDTRRSAGGSTDGALLSFVNEMDRRLTVIQDRIDAQDRLDTAQGNQIQEILTRLDKLERMPATVAAAPETIDPDGATEDAPSKTELEIAESLNAQIAKQAIAVSRAHLVLKFKTWSDTSAQGELDRRANAFVEAERVLKHFGGEQEEVRQIFLSYYERLATEVGPLVSQGVEAADYETVRPRYLSALDDRDGKVAKLLDAKSRKRWTKQQEHERKVLTEILTPRK